MPARHQPVCWPVRSFGTGETIVTHQIATRDEWLTARKRLLRKEKELTRLRDELAQERRALPWVRIDKDYVFSCPAGEVSLSDLFAGRSQLIVKHFMMGPGVSHQCIGCSLDVDHVEGILVHLENHDVTFAAISRAPIEEIEVVRQKMGWRFPWVSSFNSDFNYDFGVSFTPEQLASDRASYNFQPVEQWAVGLQDVAGRSVFFKDEHGEVFHTYSTFARGDEEFLTIYRYLDIAPKGRNENGPYHSMADWVRPHDQYGRGGTVEPNGRFHAAPCECATHK
jgi:predicted dithiol-disulfide oxidoreductase (DUF899 family)